MGQHCFNELRAIAAETATLTATRIKDKRAELTNLWEYTNTKSSAVDPVTVVDTLAEDFIANRLQELRPEDGLIGEEGTGTASISGVTWIVDPIDGTVNFLYGLPQYAVSIAAAIDGEVVTGAVINVETGVLYTAARGEGASKYMPASDEIIALRASGASVVSEALVATGFSYSALRRSRQAHLLTSVLPSVRDIRRMGSAALDLCHLADGQVDIYYEHGLNCWDFAAGTLIAAEAGAVVEAPGLSIPGSSGEICFAASPGVFADARAHFESIKAFEPLDR
ncbi:fructose-1,6-bisphosphatase [Corynebacterium deserti GIMN1.010]|uniref:Inositol-1-monophosphatase n=1 Tax=Corynebacterium deserti GIMN1.010 TaxID=931089 RepID=A0A0M5IR86_9CORY|nr:inositol monophosphatase family protein [Corynebacterium deserti]ALC06098.1 fructose-1,6-bisphosphatase [Corynebacterium deserti GIMN1.010]